jgi:hypothetical protein
MAEENKMKKRGLGRKDGKEPGKPIPVSTAEESPVTTVIKSKDAKSQSIIVIIVVALLGFGVVGSIVWKILYDNQEKFSDVAKKSSEVKKLVAQVNKTIPEVKNLADLNSLKGKANEAVKDLETLKEKAKSIGDEETSKNIDSDLEVIKSTSAKINNLIERESKTVSAINDIKNSIQPLVNVEKLNCDQLLDAPKKFGVAIAKLKNPKNIPSESFVHVDTQKLINDYINSVQKASNLYKEKKCGVKLPSPAPNNSTPVNSEPVPANPEPIPSQSQPEYVPPSVSTPEYPPPAPKSDGVPICPPGKPLKDC